MNTKELVKFLKELDKNNNKAWFDANRDRYKVLREEFKELVGDLIFVASDIDSGIGILEPKNCMFRINRDIRFSKNKNPYKTQFSASISSFSKKTGPGYYMHIDKDGKMWLAGGLYVPSSDELYKLREAIAKDASELKKIIGEKKFKETFDIFDVAKLKTAPRGFDREHPEIELLRLKHFVVLDSQKVKLGADLRKEIVKEAGSVFKMIAPLVKWIRKTLA